MLLMLARLVISLSLLFRCCTSAAFTCRATRYRAPELLVDYRTYGTAVDVWSAGCILAELIRRRPLFCGRNFAEQLKIIVSVLGTPTGDDLSFVTNQEMLKLLHSWKPKKRVRATL